VGIVGRNDDYLENDPRRAIPATLQSGTLT